MNRQLSQSFPITSGLQQGFILGSLLFSMYTSDILNSLKHCRKVQAYADDTQLYKSFSFFDRTQAYEDINSYPNLLSISQFNFFLIFKFLNK